MVGPTDGGAPGSIRPMLATLGALPADEDGWAFEFKWDGIRAVCYLDAGAEARFESRGEKDLTDGFPQLQPSEAGRQLLAGKLPAILDGEIVAFDDHGVPRFQALQGRGQNRSTPIAYVVFDVLWLEGRSLIDETYADRRQMLESIGLDAITNWSVSPSFAGDGQAVFDTSAQRGLEGVMAKRTDSRYVPGRRTPAWVKVKHTQTETFLVVGFTGGTGSRQGSVGALLLATDVAEGLSYVGKVGSGFSSEQLHEFETILPSLTIPDSPFDPPIPPADARGVTWVEPVLRGIVKYTEWTSAGRLRQPVWLGLAGQ
jgi:bifunctional non-homologous end joining protein LigD